MFKILYLPTAEYVRKYYTADNIFSASDVDSCHDVFGYIVYDNNYAPGPYITNMPLLVSDRVISKHLLEIIEVPDEV